MVSKRNLSEGYIAYYTLNKMLSTYRKVEVQYVKSEYKGIIN